MEGVANHLTPTVSKGFSAFLSNTPQTPPGEEKDTIVSSDITKASFVQLQLMVGSVRFNKKPTCVVKFYSSGRIAESQVGLYTTCIITLLLEVTKAIDNLPIL